MARIYICIFSELTELELRSYEGVCTMSHGTKVNITSGDGILLINKDRQYVFGATRATSSAYKPTTDLSQNVYSNHKYNKWEVTIRPIVYFTNPILYEELRELIGASVKYKTNIYKGFLNSFQEAFVSLGKDIPAPDSSEILKKLNFIIKLHV